MEVYDGYDQYKASLSRDINDGKLGHFINNKEDDIFVLKTSSLTMLTGFDQYFGNVFIITLYELPTLAVVEFGVMINGLY